MKKILLTSAGGLTGTFLTKHFAKSGKYNIVGADMSKDVPLKEMLCSFYKIPPCVNKNYITQIKKIVINEKIDAIIPVSSYDINALSKYDNDTMLGKKMLIVGSELNNRLHNKENSYRFLRELGVNTPEIYSVGNIKYPAILKPKESSGSKGVSILKEKKDIDCELLDDKIIVEFLTGDEYTVDCFFDKNSVCKGFNIRKRIKMLGGGAVISQNEYIFEREVIDVISKLEHIEGLVGPINFQFKIKDKAACVFDFNTRLASGGLPLTVASGFDIPDMIVENILGNYTESWKCSLKYRSLKMIRYFEEAFFDE